MVVSRAGENSPKCRCQLKRSTQQKSWILGGHELERSLECNVKAKCISPVWAEHLLQMTSNIRQMHGKKVHQRLSHLKLLRCLETDRCLQGRLLFLYLSFLWASSIHLLPAVVRDTIIRPFSFSPIWLLIFPCEHPCLTVLSRAAQHKRGAALEVSGSV